MDKEIKVYVKNCSACLEYRNEPMKSEPMSWKEATYLMAKVHVNFLNVNKDNFLILTDVHSKWPKIIEMRKINSGVTIEKLRKIFARLGLPVKVVTDNEPQFKSEEFIEFCKNNRIELIFLPPSFWDT